MSCYWHIQCVTCNETLVFDNANHAERSMSEIIAHADVLARIPFGGDIHVRFDCLDGYIDTGWFAVHEGHKLIPIDEYGRLLTQCHGDVICKCCGARSACKGERGHEGEHHS